MNFSKLRGFGRRKTSATVTPQGTIKTGAATPAKRASALLALLTRAARWRFPGAADAPWLLLAWDIGGVDAAIVGGNDRAAAIVRNGRHRVCRLAIEQCGEHQPLCGEAGTMATTPPSANRRVILPVAKRWGGGSAKR